MIDVLTGFIMPAAASILPSRMDTREARVPLLAIALQESRITYREQMQGPARGFWQFEMIGVRAVLEHPATRVRAGVVCDLLQYEPTVRSVYEAIEHNDVLAAVFARLLLWQHPDALPALGDADAAWQYYIDQWRPGRPHRRTWDNLYQQAMEFMT